MVTQREMPEQWETGHSFPQIVLGAQSWWYCALAIEYVIWCHDGFNWVAICNIYIYTYICVCMCISTEQPKTTLSIQDFTKETPRSKGVFFEVSRKYLSGSELSGHLALCDLSVLSVCRFFVFFSVFFFVRRKSMLITYERINFYTCIITYNYPL